MGKNKEYIKDRDGNVYEKGKKEDLLKPKPVKPMEVKPKEKPTRDGVILELKILRRLLEVLSMTGFVAAFDEFHVQEFLKGNGYGDDEEDDAPFNLAFVMATFNNLVDVCSAEPKELEAYRRFSQACSLVAPKCNIEELGDITKELKANPLYGLDGIGSPLLRYTYFTLPKLLKMIDLALKDDDGKA